MQLTSLVQSNQQRLQHSITPNNLDNIIFVDFRRLSLEPAILIRKINNLFYSQHYSLQDLSRKEILTRELLEDKDVLGFPNIEGITYLGSIIINHFLKEMQESEKANFKQSIDQFFLYNYLRINNTFVGKEKLSAIFAQLESAGKIKLDDNWLLPLNYLPVVLREIQGYITGETILKLFDDKNITKKLRRAISAEEITAEQTIVIEQQEDIITPVKQKKTTAANYNPYSKHQKIPLKVTPEAKHIFKILLDGLYVNNKQSQLISAEREKCAKSNYSNSDNSDNSEKIAFSSNLSQYELREQIKKYTPLVKKIARIVKRRTFNTELDDLISAGYIGLLNGLKRLDSNRQEDPAYYLGTRIMGAMYDDIRGLDYLTQRTRRKVKRYKKAAEKVSAIYNEVTDELIAKELEMEVDDKFRQLKEYASFRTSHIVDNYETKSNYLLDFLITKSLNHSGNKFVIDEQIDDHQPLLYLAVVIAQLPKDKEELFLSLYSGISQEEISRNDGVTAARINQKVTKLIPLIQRNLKNYLWMYTLEF